ncbi:sugar ABC transporter permease [Paenibacillus athensensis]|uniref:ABC transmembrane type-1 domain-containing protein n=1 Tax=Paenibacillus athensensis TaxID=1967502 RepID=A0A4Y8PTE4_9BACL|nr:sugar ABC transporter permease [Paenibacillus athensensis]MCD1261767.1 sugar ABC transporter permease [Paenibacillus athensensis]
MAAIKSALPAKAARRSWHGLLFFAPFAVFFLGFEIYPMLRAFYLSLFDYGLGQQSWVGWGNYTQLLHDRVFIRSVVNTLGFVFGSVPLTFIFAMFAAMVIYNKSKHVASFFRGAFYLPIVASQVILSIVWAWIYNPVSGVANYLLSFAHLGPFSWLSSEHLALPALVLIVVTFNVGQPIILLLAGMGNISPDYYEAADLDGASVWSKFIHITVPLLKPTSLYILVMTTIWAFQTFIVVQMLTGGGPNYATSTIMYLLYNTAFVYGQLGLASAMGIVITALISVVALLQFKLMKSDVEY